MTLQASGLRSFCELLWPLYIVGRPQLRDQGWLLWARAVHAGLEVEVAMIVLRVRCTLLFIPRLPQAWGSKLCREWPFHVPLCKQVTLLEGSQCDPGAKIASLVTGVCSAPGLSKQPLTPAHCWLGVWTHSYLFAGANDCLCTQSWGQGPPLSSSLAHVLSEQVAGPQN